MARSLGIDLGTANTIICVKGKGIVLREPSFVAIDSRSRRLCAAGIAAKQMCGTTPGEITAFRPIKDGVIADFRITADMLEYFFRKIGVKSVFNRPNVVVSIPYSITEVEKRAVEDAALDAGAKSVALIEEPIAAAIGTGLRVGEARGCMIIDIGGGTTEVAVMSLGGIVVSNFIKIGGDQFDAAIVSYMKRKHNVTIGEATAEALKKNIGSVHSSADRGAMEVKGRNLMTGLPAIIKVNSWEIREALAEPLEKIIECIRLTLETTPPELSGDIFDIGIMLTGGSALLGGFDTLISKVTGTRVMTAKRPLDSVAVGIGRVIESENAYREFVDFRLR